MKHKYFRRGNNLLRKALIGKIKYVVKAGIPITLREKLQPRKLRAYCIGAPKTGTTTLHSLIGNTLRSGHEPDYLIFHKFLDERRQIRGDEYEFVRFLKRRDKQLWLEFDSSWYLGHVVEAMAQAFIDAKYLVTLREPYAWLDSMFNAIRNFASPELRAINPHCFDWLQISCRPDLFKFSPHDKVLEKEGMIPMESLLSFYSNHYYRINDTLPTQKRLILRTEDISSKLDEINAFLCIKIVQFKSEGKRFNVAPRRYYLLSLLDRSYLEDIVHQYCSSLILKYYPNSSGCPEKLLQSV